jgi:hypothetical protein
MAIDYSGFPEHLRKPAPRVLVKKARKTAESSDEKRIKREVRTRDKFCRVCLYRPSSEVHELIPRSVGGKVSTFNSVGVCAARNSGLCHQLLQSHSIHYEFLQPGRGADGTMRFSMNQSVADAVFGRRVVPKHCKVTK